MVEQSDRARLLDWEEIPPTPPVPTQAAPPTTKKKNAPAERTSSPPDGRGRGHGRPGDCATCAECGAAGGAPCRVTAAVAGGDGGGGSRPARLRVDHPDHHVGLSVKEQWEEKDQIVAVFVVTFDTRSGKSRGPKWRGAPR